MKTHASRLLNAPALLEEVFPDQSSRPSVRWIRIMQAKRLIPYYKVGGLVFFDPDEVREALAKMRVRTVA